MLPWNIPTYQDYYSEKTSKCPWRSSEKSKTDSTKKAT